MITDNRLDSLTDPDCGFDLDSDEAQRVCQELKQWRKLGRELDAYSYIFPIDLDLLRLKLRQLLVSIEGKE